MELSCSIGFLIMFTIFFFCFTFSFASISDSWRLKSKPSNIARPTISEKAFDNMSENPPGPMPNWLFYFSLLEKQLILIVLKVFVSRENKTIILIKNKTLIFLEHEIFPFFRKMTFSFTFDDATLFLVLYQHVSKKASVIHKYSEYYLPLSQRYWSW